MQYIDLNYYVTHGGKQDDAICTAFTNLEFRARKLVDRYTQNRVRDMAEVPEAVQMLMVELVALEATQGAAALDNQVISSFSNDGYSETYAEPLTAERIREQENELILTYLLGEQDDNGIPLLWLGVE